MTTHDAPAAAIDAYLDLAIGREPRAGVRLALDLLDGGVPSDAVIEGLLGAAQREVGERWMRDEWTVADEHLVSGVTQKALDAVAKLIARYRPDALAVSCNLPLFFSGLSRLVDAAHAQGVPVLAGGRALGMDPARATRLGADGWGATVTDAVSVLEGWGDHPPQLSAASGMLEPAALQLDASAASLADTAFDRLVGEFPQMRSYDDRQLARTREDLAFIVQFAAAARLVDDPNVLTDFLAWLGTLLGNRGVPPSALHAGLRVLAPLIGDLDPRAGQMVMAALVPEPAGPGGGWLDGGAQ